MRKDSTVKNVPEDLDATLQFFSMKIGKIEAELKKMKTRMLALDRVIFPDNVPLEDLEEMYKEDVSNS